MYDGDRRLRVKQAELIPLQSLMDASGQALMDAEDDYEKRPGRDEFYTRQLARLQYERHCKLVFLTQRDIERMRNELKGSP